MRLHKSWRYAGGDEVTVEVEDDDASASDPDGVAVLQGVFAWMCRPAEQFGPDDPCDVLPFERDAA